MFPPHWIPPKCLCFSNPVLAGAALPVAHSGRVSIASMLLPNQHREELFDSVSQTKTALQAVAR